jgi:hypothetical protein
MRRILSILLIRERVGANFDLMQVPAEKIIMRKLWISLLIMAVLVAGTGTAAAQDPILPPTIISFTSNLAVISLADAEAGQTVVELSWQVVGLGEGQKLALYAYRFNAWQPLLAADAPPLPSEGSTAITVESPENFGPPTYSLVIVDARGQTVDQRVLIIPYDLSALSGPPQIDNFTSTIQTLDITQVITQNARVPVGWTVSNRPPLSNLVFEQVLDAGQVISVELPRPNLWIASAGEGIVAPVIPETGNVIRLQMRVVNMADGTTLAQQTLPPIQLTGTLPPSPAPTPTIAPTARILSFQAAPNTVTRGGVVTVTWQVIGSTDIGVWLLDPSGRLSVSAPNPSPTGSWSVTLPDYYSGQANFMIFADDASGTRAQSSLSVRIVCNFTYFFPSTPEMACPQTDVGEVQAAFEIFENGYMLWRGDNSDIYVLLNTGEVRVIKDRWQGEIITFPEQPPAGLYQPMRGFGRVWVDDPALRMEIGWAVTLEQGYTMNYQLSSDFSPRLYVNWPDGTVIYMNLYGDTGTWDVAP